MRSSVRRCWLCGRETSPKRVMTRARGSDTGGLYMTTFPLFSMEVTGETVICEKKNMNCSNTDQDLVSWHVSISVLQNRMFGDFLLSY